MNIIKVRQQIKTQGLSFYDLPLRVAYYARVSTEFMEQLNSLENQKKFFTEYIGNMPNWEFAGGYIDEGLSGITTKKRERFNEMIADALNDNFDLIVTKEVSRFARNTLDSIKYTRELLQNGVAVFFQNDNINTLDEDSELRLTIMASMAQDESRKISSRVKWGHRQAIKNGVVLGSSNIFGYRKADKRLYIDEEQAEIVKELFTLYSTGKWTMKGLENYFYDKGIRNTKGNKLSHTTMANMIRNPKYKGYYVGNKVKVVDMFTKKQEFLPESEWVMYKDETGEIVPAIVDEEMWELANKVLEMRSIDVKSKQHKTVHQNLLTGKLWCPHCGLPYYRKDSVSPKGTRCSIWKCSGRLKNGADSCPSCSIYESEIVPILEDVFTSAYDNIASLSELIHSLSRELMQKDSMSELIKQLNASIANEQKKKQKLLQLNVNGQFPDAEFIRMTAECDAEIAKAQEEIDRLTDSIKQKKDITDQMEQIRKILLTAQSCLKKENIDRAFVDQFIRRITVHVDEPGTVENPVKMRLEIELNSGNILEKSLIKTLIRRSQRSKKMIESYENGLK